MEALRLLFAAILLAPIVWIYRRAKQLEAWRYFLLVAAFVGVIWSVVLPVMSESLRRSPQVSNALHLAWERDGWYMWPVGILLIGATAGAYAGWWRSAVATPPLTDLGSTFVLRLAIAAVPTAASAVLGSELLANGPGDGWGRMAWDLAFAIFLILAPIAIVLSARTLEALSQWILLPDGPHAARLVSAAKAAGTRSDLIGVRQSTGLVLVPALVPIGLALSFVLDDTVFSRKTINLELVGVFIVNALYLGAPHLFFGVLARWRHNLSRHAIPVLWCLNLYLIAFFMWESSRFAPRDAAFIWLAYLPGSLVVLLLFWRFPRRSKP